MSPYWETLSAVLAFLLVQVGLIVCLAVGDLNGLAEEWARGYIDTSNFLKVIGYAGLLFFAILSSVGIPLLFTLPR